MQLLVSSFGRFDELPADVRADLYDLIGWQPAQDKAITALVRDRWLVVGQRQRTLLDGRQRASPG